MSKQWGHGYHTGYYDAIKQNDSIVGMFFHSYDNGQIKWQGQVIKKLNNSRFIVQLYSWVGGHATTQKVISLSDVKDWSFYNSDKEMRHAYYLSLNLDPEKMEKLESKIFA